jgi:hypothetical protein
MNILDLDSHLARFVCCRRVQHEQLPSLLQIEKDTARPWLAGRFVEWVCKPV